MSNTHFEGSARESKLLKHDFAYGLLYLIVAPAILSTMQIVYSYDVGEQYSMFLALGASTISYMSFLFRRKCWARQLLERICFLLYICGIAFAAYNYSSLVKLIYIGFLCAISGFYILGARRLSRESKVMATSYYRTSVVASFIVCMIMEYVGVRFINARYRGAIYDLQSMIYATMHSYSELDEINRVMSELVTDILITYMVLMSAIIIMYGILNACITLFIHNDNEVTEMT